MDVISQKATKVWGWTTGTRAWKERKRWKEPGTEARKEGGNGEHTGRGARRGQADLVSVQSQEFRERVVRKLKKQNFFKMQLSEGHM